MNLFEMNRILDSEQMYTVNSLIICAALLSLLAIINLWKHTPEKITRRVLFPFSWALAHKALMVILVLLSLGFYFYIQGQTPPEVKNPPNPLPAPYMLSFPEDVELVTPSGSVLIRDIKIGDVVTSFDTETKIETTSAVKMVFTRMDNEFVVINQQLRVTRRHPFAVRDSSGQIAWKEAGDIVSGDCLFSTSEHCIVVENITIKIGAPEQVYNIHVTGPENYFVLINTTPILVHNKSLPTT